MNERSYLVKIIPPKGYAVYTLEFARRHLAMLCVLLVCAVGGALAIHAYELHAAERQVQELRAVEATRLRQIDAQASRLSSELERLERQNAEIRRAIGVEPPARRRSTGTHALAPHSKADFATVAGRLAQVAADSERARAETVALNGLARRILNLRRIESIARARMLAAIPSIVPAGSGEIASGFGYRMSPYREFHKGVDLEADYGDTVRAAAKGVVAFVGWDGGFGNKVDIDHGNGLHTWYCHLSRFSVHVGQTVVKGEPIAAVGSTGEATGPHLHYQVMRDGNPIDPRPFLIGEGAKLLGLDTSGSLRL